MNNEQLTVNNEKVKKRKNSPPLTFFFLFSLFFSFSLPLIAQPAQDESRPSSDNMLPNAPSQLSPLRPVQEERQPLELPVFDTPWIYVRPELYQNIEDDPVQVSAPPELPEPETGPRFAVLPSSVRPGEPITVAYADEFTGPGSRDFRAVLLNTQGRRVISVPLYNFTRATETYEVKAAIIAVPSTVNPGVFTIRIEAGGTIIQDLPVIIEPRDFVSEVIELDERNTEIRVAPNPQRDLESNILWAIISRTGTEFYHEGPFIAPVTSTRRTSFYGDRRVFQYADGSTDAPSIHAGVDFGVPTGTEVRACGRGRVVLAVSRISTGNSVILEHMPGVYSHYYHLDSISVEEGSIVEAGELLGLSGSTGLSTGPHLHWEIRVATENTDPDAFVARAVLDKDEILRNLVTVNR